MMAPPTIPVLRGHKREDKRQQVLSWSGLLCQLPSGHQSCWVFLLLSEHSEEIKRTGIRGGRGELGMLQELLA